MPACYAGAPRGKAPGRVATVGAKISTRCASAAHAVETLPFSAATTPGCDSSSMAIVFVHGGVSGSRVEPVSDLAPAVVAGELEAAALDAVEKAIHVLE